jgi:hypothetical protein
VASAGQALPVSDISVLIISPSLPTGSNLDDVLDMKSRLINIEPKNPPMNNPASSPIVNIGLSSFPDPYFFRTAREFLPSVYQQGI